MCGRCTLSSRRLTTLEGRPGHSFPEVQLCYHIAPSPLVSSVRQADGKCALAVLKWWLLPAGAVEAELGYSTINARAETVEC